MVAGSRASCNDLGLELGKSSKVFLKAVARAAPDSETWGRPDRKASLGRHHRNGNSNYLDDLQSGRIGDRFSRQWITNLAHLVDVKERLCPIGCSHDAALALGCVADTYLGETFPLGMETSASTRSEIARRSIISSMIRAPMSSSADWLGTRIVYCESESRVPKTIELDLVWRSARVGSTGCFGAVWHDHEADWAWHFSFRCRILLLLLLRRTSRLRGKLREMGIPLKA